MPSVGLIGGGSRREKLFVREEEKERKRKERERKKKKKGEMAAAYE